MEVRSRSSPAPLELRADHHSLALREDSKGQPGPGAWRRGPSGCQEDACFNYYNVNKVSTNSCQKEPKNGFI